MADDAPARPPPIREARRAFVAFAGGGAKGVAHVGALSALEQRDVDVVGYAGTSAGAIVAALAAAGFKADEIMHPDEPRSIVDLLKTFDDTLNGPTDFFGPNGWLHVAAFRALLQSATSTRVIAAVVGAAVALLVSAVSIGLFGFPAAVLVILVWIIVVGLVAVVAISCLVGLSRLHTLRNAVNGLLSRKLFEAEPDRTVVMGDFDGKDRPALKIVAANLSKRRLELFSSDTTKDVAVADAIAASICLPLIFDLWTFEHASFKGDRFVDGGIVSNLPAWPFDEERELDPDALTIAFAIGDADLGAAEPKPIGRLAWFPALLQTMMFGSTKLSTRAVGRSELITLRPDIGLMDFDLDSDPARDLLRRMTTDARKEIDERLFRFPDTYRETTASLVTLAEQTLDRAPWALAAGVRTGRIRVAVALPPEDYVHSLRLRFGANFGEDPDQGMLLPIDGSLVGVAWEEQLPQFDLAPFPPEVWLPKDEHAALKRLVWRELAWSLRVPIFGSDGRPKCVVTVDGSDRLNDTGDTREAFEDLADQIISIFTPIVQRLREASSDGKIEH